MDKRFKLRGQHHVHEDERKHESEHEVIARASQLFRTAGQTALVCRVHVLVFSELVHLADHCGLRTAGPYVREQSYLTLAIEPIDGRRTSPFFEPNEIVETDPT